MTQTTTAADRPFPRLVEANYARLAKDSGWPARNFWRAVHAQPILLTRSITDALDRIYAVPSTRDEDVYYEVHLNESTCIRVEGETREVCGDWQYNNRGLTCCHIRAAENREARLFEECDLDRLMKWRLERAEMAA